VPRWLHTLLVALIIVTTSGLPAAVGETTAELDDAHGAPGETCPEDDGGCPPSCDGCMCRPHLGLVAVRAVDGPFEAPRLVPFSPAPRACPAPPPRGVFHPPRPFP
jgi:hypothetical protein